jgi:hypothetical protein
MASRTLILCCSFALGALGALGVPARGEPSPAPMLPVPATLAAAGTGDQAAIARQPVAVIDLTNDQAVREVAYKLLELLASHAELAPPAVSDGAALVDKLPPDDEPRLTDARHKLQSAIKNLAQRSFREAAIDAVEGQEALWRVTPHAALALYADLELALGQSRLGEQKDAEAREAFALTHRLDPNRTLDERRYVPEVIQTFEEARAVQPGLGTIAVRGTGQVWIDGQEVGPAPGEFPATLGRHVVWLTGMLRETAGKEVVVTAARPGDATILDGPLTRPQKVVRYRIALAQAQDPAARAAAMTALAGFVNVHDAVLLSAVNGKILWQTWRDREPGFGEIRELGRDRPGEILRSLVPPHPVLGTRTAGLPALPAPWYRRRTVQLGVAATVVAAAIGGYFWAHYHEPDRPWNPDITGFGTGSGRGP